jgi:nitrate/nitrite-specific signal transduction histidine kinase
MRERVALVEGQLRLHSRPGEGTEVVARVPARGAGGDGGDVPVRS